LKKQLMIFYVRSTAEFRFRIALSFADSAKLPAEKFQQVFRILYTET